MSDWTGRRVADLPRDSFGRPYAFRDLPADQLPLMIQVHDEVNRELLWQIVIAGPCALSVPSFAPRTVRVTTTVLATGETTIVDSQGNVIDECGNIIEAAND